MSPFSFFLPEPRRCRCQWWPPLCHHDLNESHYQRRTLVIYPLNIIFVVVVVVVLLQPLHWVRCLMELLLVVMPVHCAHYLIRDSHGPTNGPAALVPPGLLCSGLRLPVLRPQMPMLIHRSSDVLLPLPVQAGPQRRAAAVLLFVVLSLTQSGAAVHMGVVHITTRPDQARPVLTRRTPSVIIFLYCFAGLKYKTRPS